MKSTENCTDLVYWRLEALILVAGPSILNQLHEHPDNLFPSGLTPRAMNGTSMHPLWKLPELEGINIQRNFTSPYAKPFCVHTARAVPFAYRDKLKAELDLLQRQGIIAPVTKPTEWCAPIVVAPKYVRREKYQSLTPAQVVADIAAGNAKISQKERVSSVSS